MTDRRFDWASCLMFVSILTLSGLTLMFVGYVIYQLGKGVIW